MASHSSVLAWRIPGMGEPGGLPSMGSHRVRHDWSDLAAYSGSDRKESAHSVGDLCYSKIKEEMAEEEVRDLRNRGQSSAAASKTMNTSALQLQRTEFCKKLEWIWKWILLQRFRIRVQPSQTLILNLCETSSREPGWVHPEFSPAELQDDK